MSAPDFSAATIQTLAARASLICSNPDCSTLTVGPLDAKGDLVTKLGEAAHIRAARPGPPGPRYDPSMTDAERADISNGIWLCASCHTMIDKNDGAGFPTPKLMDWKARHEATLQSLLRTHRSPLPTLRRFTEEGQIAQDVVDLLEQHGALFVDLNYEVSDHVLASIDRLRSELIALNRRIRYDTSLKQIIKELGQLCREYMNHTSRFSAGSWAELETLRRRVGVKVLRLRDEYGCSIRGPLGHILP